MLRFKHLPFEVGRSADSLCGLHCCRNVGHRKGWSNRQSSPRICNAMIHLPKTIRRLGRKQGDNIFPLTLVYHEEFSFVG